MAVPKEVSEKVRAIIKEMKKEKEIPADKMYEIAYGTAWKEFYSGKNANSVLENLKIAQFFDNEGLFLIADKFDK